MANDIINEIRKSLKELNDYIKKIESYVYYTNKPQYLEIHTHIFELMIPTKELDHYLYSYSLEELKNAALKIKNIRNQIINYTNEKGIRIQDVESEYNKIILSNIIGTKTTTDDKVLDIEEKINNLPTATLTDVPELEGVQNLDSRMRL